jgi:hypothetical protein
VSETRSPRKIKQEIRDLAHQANSVAEDADAAGRQLTKSEKEFLSGSLRRLDTLNAELKLAKDADAKTAAETRRRVDEVGSRMAGGGDIAGDGSGLPNDGWSSLASTLVRGKATKAEIDLGDVIRTKALAHVDAAELAVGDAPFVPLQADERYVFGNFPSRSLSGQLAVQGLRQTGSRTITGAVERDPQATTTKAELGVELSVIEEAVVQHALLISGVPNAVLDSMESLRSFLASELAMQIREALDTHVLGKIAAASIPFGNTGTGLFEQIRNGISELRAAGHNPTLAILAPSDVASIDLTAEDTMPRAWPFGLRVIESKSATDPIIVAPNAGGLLWRGNLRVETDPYSGFDQNLTTFRGEADALFQVADSSAYYRIGIA